MPEQPPTIEEDVESKEKAELLPYFPTDFERATDGVKKFNEVFDKYAILQKISKGDQWFKNKLLYSATGLMPETGFYWGGGFEETESDEERAQLKNILEKDLGLKTLDWQGEKHGHSIINPRSVEKIIKNCPIPGLFPDEAKADPVHWVLSNPLEWVDDNEPVHKARFGILSGYPPHGSVIFADYIIAKDSFIDGALSERERKSYYKYANSNRHERKLPSNIEKKLKSAVENNVINERQGEAVKNFFINSGEIEMFGDGFCDEDEKYFKNVKSILEKISK